MQEKINEALKLTLYNMHEDDVNYIKIFGSELSKLSTAAFFTDTGINAVFDIIGKSNVDSVMSFIMTFKYNLLTNGVSYNDIKNVVNNCLKLYTDMYKTLATNHDTPLHKLDTNFISVNNELNNEMFDLLFIIKLNIKKLYL